MVLRPDSPKRNNLSNVQGCYLCLKTRGYMNLTSGSHRVLRQEIRPCAIIKSSWCCLIVIPVERLLLRQWRTRGTDLTYITRNRRPCWRAKCKCVSCSAAGNHGTSILLYPPLSLSWSCDRRFVARLRVLSAEVSSQLTTGWLNLLIAFVRTLSSFDIYYFDCVSLTCLTYWTMGTTDHRALACAGRGGGGGESARHSSELTRGTRYHHLRYVPRGAVPYCTERYRAFVAKFTSSYRTARYKISRKKLFRSAVPQNHFSCFFSSRQNHCHVFSSGFLITSSSQQLAYWRRVSDLVTLVTIFGFKRQFHDL